MVKPTDDLEENGTKAKSLVRRFYASFQKKTRRASTNFEKFL